MIGDIDDRGDLGAGVLDGDLDALAEGGLRHGAPLAAAAHGEVHGVTVDTDEGCEAAMAGDRRIDLMFDDGKDPGGDLRRRP